MDRVPIGDEVMVVTWSGDDGDGVGRLTIVARSQGFGGTGHAWFHRDTVVDFADRLASYPLPAYDPPALSSGMGESIDFQEQVGLAVEPIGKRGQIDVRIHLANEMWPGNPPEGRYEVRMHLLTSHEALGTFAIELRSVIEGRTPSASLLGDRFR